MDAGKSVQIFDLAGTLIIEHHWPKPRHHLRQQPPTPRPHDRTVTDVLRHEGSPMS